jgi:hypothetical protein
MKLLKKAVMSLALSAAMLMPCVKVSAQEPLYVYLGEYKAENDVLSLQVGNNQENSTDSFKYTVTLGDKELELLSVSEYGEEALNTSYIYLVDISGSMAKDDMDNIQDTLRSLINNLEDGDNAGIMLVGDDAYTDEFVSDREVLLERADSIEKLHEDTNLYYAINQALDILATSNQSRDRKCLVILSDGQDDKITGITADEVKSKIEETNIPICSVAMTGRTADEDIAKTMGSFARLSPGGVNMVFGVDGTDAETVAGQVKAVAENMVVLKADISDYEPNGTENYLQVELTVDGVGSAVDGYNVKSVNISRGVTPHTEESTESTESTVAEIDEETQENEDVETSAPLLLIIGLAALLIIIIILAVLLIVSGRKKKARQEELENQERLKKLEQSEQSKQSNQQNKNEKETSDTGKKTEAPTDNASGTETLKPDMRPRIKATLTRVGIIEEEIREIEIVGELTIGRKPELSDLAFPTDQQLSGRHCRLTYDGVTLRIEDLNSLNGTLVNGVPIQIPYELHKDDTIFIGSSEWRIGW